MAVRFATKEEIDNWDKKILSNDDGGNVFSSYEFAMQKETGGYKARFVVIDSLSLTVLEKRIPTFGKLWYLPKGPGVKSTHDFFKVLTALSFFAKRNGVFAIRTEPELTRDQQPVLKRHGFIKSTPIIPNPSTITLDISSSLENILVAMPQKGRHAINRAIRDGVTTKLVDSSDTNCETMYRLLAETAKGQFGIRGYEYYRTFWQRFESAGYGQMFFAYYDEKIVSGAYAMSFGKKSTYKDGASIRKRTAYGASHLLQWSVIEWAQSKGSKIHDFCGSPSSDEINNPNHKHYGIGQFKTAFSKTVTDYIGCYDYVINPIKYRIWINFVEKVAHRLHYYKHRDSYY